MTRVTVDAATAAKLNGLGEYLELYDEDGRLLGRFEPNENSPVLREWLRNLGDGLTEEELERQIKEGGGITTEDLVQRLRRNKS